ncbi:unnamed protein product [Soboliphyme baturini]|uniref:BAH domain-containing protein n=1 Tax=Soboliphyme baturini TaxID=241478 RepID=A0A183J4X3_9BILA|nr:unnamed protein product [Soboliphyme baturini]
MVLQGTSRVNESKTPDLICKKMTKREQLNVLVKWYYRPCELPEVVYDSLLQERNSEEHCKYRFFLTSLGFEGSGSLFLSLFFFALYMTLIARLVAAPYLVQKKRPLTGDSS